MVAAVLLVLAVFTTVAPSPASASDGNTAKSSIQKVKKSVSCVTYVGITMPAGPGHADGPVFAGTFKCGKFVGFCGDFALHNPNSSSSTATFNKWPGLSTEKSRIAATITATYQDTKDEFTTAAAAMAVWGVINTPAFRKYNAWLAATGQFPEVRARAAEMLNDATNRAGTRAAVSLTPAYTGQTSAGFVQATGALGSPVSGLKVKLDANKNGKLSVQSGVTDANGVVAFNLRKTGYGTVEVDASVTVIDTGYILRTTPSVGRQRIFRVPRMKNIKANASYQLKLGAPTVQTVCDTDCSGNATVSVSFCNPAGASTYRLFGTVGDTTVLKQDIPGDGSCPVYTLRLHDENVLILSYCLVKKGKCFTDKFQTVVYEIKCAPAPEVYLNVKCNCNGMTLFELIAAVPASSRVFTMTASVNGVPNIGTAVLTNGQNNPIPVSGVTPGSTVVVNIVATHQVTGELMGSWSYTVVAPVTGTASAKRSNK